MSIDYDAITTELIAIARDEVGLRLGTYKDGGTIPAIMRARNNPKGNEPKTPYIWVDLIDTRKVQEGLPCYDLDPVLETQSVIQPMYTVFRWYVHGKDQWEAHTIATDLANSFYKTVNQDRLRAIGVGFKEVEIILSVPEFLSTSFHGVSVFELTLSARSILTETIDIIESIDVGDASGNPNYLFQPCEASSYRYYGSQSIDGVVGLVTDYSAVWMDSEWVGSTLVKVSTGQTANITANDVATITHDGAFPVERGADYKIIDRTTILESNITVSTPL